MYWLTRWHRARLALLLMGSLVFYGFARADLVVLLVAVAGFGWIAGLWLARTQFKQAVLALAVGVLLLTLGLFKYGHLLIEHIRTLHFPGRVEAWILLLPLGISFFVFEIISYLVDIHRGALRPERSPFRFGLFVAFFPHLIAGPIMRGSDLLPQFDRMLRFDVYRTLSGARLFTLGFFKKVVIADTCARVVDPVFAAPATYSSLAVWIAALAYSAQIYGDFSGYTDMGRGAARMLGYELPLNFRNPYLATSPREFWRRWHMSLSSWLRDYLYRGLGGSRHGRTRTYFSLFATMVIGGVWHGSNWTFLVWGAYHGALLTVQRFATDRRITLTVSWPLRVIATFVAVTIGWVIFRSASLEAAATALNRMLIPTNGLALATDLMVIGIAGPIATLVYMALDETGGGPARWVVRPGVGQGLILGAAAASMFYLLPLSAQPFIYFRF